MHVLATLCGERDEYEPPYRLHTDAINVFSLVLKAVGCMMLHVLRQIFYSRLLSFNLLQRFECVYPGSILNWPTDRGCGRPQPGHKSFGCFAAGSQRGGRQGSR